METEQDIEQDTDKARRHHGDRAGRAWRQSRKDVETEQEGRGDGAGNDVETEHEGHRESKKVMETEQEGQKGPHRTERGGGGGRTEGTLPPPPAPP